MKQILLMIGMVALVGCGKKPTEGSFAETKAKAEAGDAFAQFNLGNMYGYGEEVEQDLKEMVKWFQKAANQGFSGAQFNLGGMYWMGNGVEQNFVIAYAWWNIAATNGHQDAKKDLPQFAKEMTPAQIAEAEELVEEMVKKNPKLLK
jgi:uncharacterized protein